MTTASNREGRSEGSWDGAVTLCTAQFLMALTPPS